MDQSFGIAVLIHKSFEHRLTEDEARQLQEWREQSPANEETYQHLLDHSKTLEQIEVYQQYDEQQAWSAIQNQIYESKELMIYTRLWKYAAAIMLPVLMAGAIFFFTQYGVDPLAGIDEAITPGEEKAVLILSDGSQVKLNAEQATAEIKQGRVIITHDMSALKYEVSKSDSLKAEVRFNELQTPKGGQYQLLLADGTKVTLNAASSIRYPVAFTDTARIVYLTGEAFFEVTHSGTPFLVKSESQQVRVLGTKFNVMAYGDEKKMETTLVEGKVQLETKLENQLLKPGQQASWDGLEVQLKDVNTSNYTSWLNGKFQFTNDSMEEVMKRLSRWYDFTYEFQNVEAKNLHFTGRIDNSQQISAILKMLEVTTAVSFKFDDDQIIIQ